MTVFIDIAIITITESSGHPLWYWNLTIFSFFEDIPEEPFFEKLPWDWRKWSEYQASMTRNVKVPINYGTFVGHIALRLSVMGMDAWERAATADEIEEIAKPVPGEMKGK